MAIVKRNPTKIHWVSDDGGRSKSAHADAKTAATGDCAPRAVAHALAVSYDESITLIRRAAAEVGLTDFDPRASTPTDAWSIAITAKGWRRVIPNTSRRRAFGMRTTFHPLFLPEGEDVVVHIPRHVAFMERGRRIRDTWNSAKRGQGTLLSYFVREDSPETATHYWARKLTHFSRANGLPPIDERVAPYMEIGAKALEEGRTILTYADLLNHTGRKRLPGWVEPAMWNAGWDLQRDNGEYYFAPTRDRDPKPIAEYMS